MNCFRFIRGQWGYVVLGLYDYKVIIRRYNRIIVLWFQGVKGFYMNGLPLYSSKEGFLRLWKTLARWGYFDPKFGFSDPKNI